MAQTLELYQSLWAMEDRIPGQAEQPKAVHLKRIADAGYIGACLDPNVSEIEDSLKLKPLFEELGLKCMVNAFPHSADSLEPLLEMSAELQATQVNIIAEVMPLTPAEAVPIIDDWLALASDYPFPVLMETHRNSTLNDLFYTLEILKRVPQLRLCADLSHFVVDRELQLPLSAVDAAYFSTVIERSDSFQGRISNNQQIQIAIEFEQHALWVAQYFEWWRQGFNAWSARSGPNDTLRFLVELGPPPYAITDGTQRELSNRWDEALLIHDRIQAIWAAIPD
ncbi:MAG: sugar phosphate isomerase/epimerase [Candidatus Azotimanducaceae bacterium]